MPKAKDPTEAMRVRARKFPDAVEGASCTQTSFKRGGKKAFFYVGEQGGRFKAMFKLDASLAEVRKLAKTAPDDYQHGNGGWVTARFTAEAPLAKKTWEAWMKESYELAG